jgi:hypothetical protein
MAGLPGLAGPTTKANKPPVAPVPDEAPRPKWEYPWPEPVVLLDRLDGLAGETEPWATAVARNVWSLGATTSDPPDGEAVSILDRLDVLSRSADDLAVRLGERPMAAKLRRAQHALLRRLVLWRPVVEAGQPLGEPESPLQSVHADPAALLRHLEQYEQSGLPSDARRVAEDRLLVARSTEPHRREMARQLEAHYRNANMRIVLSRQLLDRLMPDWEPEQRDVDDVVLGKPVRGQSLTSAKVSMWTIPDPNRLRLALAVRGHVASLTASTSGPARFCNTSESAYLAVKEIEIDTSGIHWSPTRVAARGTLRLASLRTTLDPIPVVGDLAQKIARAKHKESQPEMSREVERKVAIRASRRIDEEADLRLNRLDEKFRLNVLKPLANLSLGPTMIDAQTTDERLTMRLRLADQEQLGACTPRPRAPAESLLSCQIHESAFNNAIEQMELDGRTLTLADLRGRIAKVLNRPEMLEADPPRREVTLTFADQDAVRVRFQDGRIAVYLSIARLSSRAGHWSDFEVRVYYRPQVDGRSLELVRDGVVELVARQRLRSQIPLRAIFCKTFSANDSFRPIPKLLTTDPRTEGLAVTQFVVDDGWIGIAFGQQESGPAPLVAQRRTTVVD